MGRRSDPNAEPAKPSYEYIPLNNMIAGNTSPSVKSNSIQKRGGNTTQQQYTSSAQSPDTRVYHGGSIEVQKFEMDSGVKIRRPPQKSMAASNNTIDEPAPPRFDQPVATVAG